MSTLKEATLCCEDSTTESTSMVQPFHLLTDGDLQKRWSEQEVITDGKDIRRKT